MKAARQGRHAGTDERAARSRLRSVAIVALCFWLLQPGRSARAADTTTVQNQVKSAFILNFIQFIDWPDGTFANADEPIIIGVLEKDPMEAVMAAAVEGKSVKGRKLVVKHFAAGAIGKCQVLYTGSLAGEQASAVVKPLAAAGVLTVGDIDSFTDIGGIVRFYIEDRKERFEINQAAAERTHLQISSKLLKLAKIVNK